MPPHILLKSPLISKASNFLGQANIASKECQANLSPLFHLARVFHESLFATVKMGVPRGQVSDFGFQCSGKAIQGSSLASLMILPDT